MTEQSPEEPAQATCHGVHEVAGKWLVWSSPTCPHAPAGPALPEQADRDADNVPSDEDRVRAYAERLTGAYQEWFNDKNAPPGVRGLVAVQAHACVAVEDRRTADLRTEVERLREEIEWGREDALGQARIEVRERLGQLSLDKRKAEATLARVEALAVQWEESTVWPDQPDRRLRGAAARLRIALSDPDLDRHVAFPEDA